MVVAVISYLNKSIINPPLFCRQAQSEPKGRRGLYSAGMLFVDSLLSTVLV